MPLTQWNLFPRGTCGTKIRVAWIEVGLECLNNKPNKDQNLLHSLFQAARYCIKIVINLSLWYCVLRLHEWVHQCKWDSSCSESCNHFDKCTLKNLSNPFVVSHFKSAKAFLEWRLNWFGDPEKCSFPFPYYTILYYTHFPWANLSKRGERCNEVNPMWSTNPWNKARPLHRELRALLFTTSAWVL